MLESGKNQLESQHSLKVISTIAFFSYLSFLLDVKTRAASPLLLQILDFLPRTTKANRKQQTRPFEPCKETAGSSNEIFHVNNVNGRYKTETKSTGSKFWCVNICHVALGLRVADAETWSVEQ